MALEKGADDMVKNVFFFPFPGFRHLLYKDIQIRIQTGIDSLLFIVLIHRRNYANLKGILSFHFI